ncbi:MAG: serine/threonine-protein kinase [Anaeromyxobacter sp.]
MSGETLLDFPAVEPDEPWRVPPPGLGPATAVAVAPRAAPGAARAVELAPGTQLGERFRIVKRLGRGSMATVYLALDLRARREVALKLVDPYLGDDPRVLARAQRELELARVVAHPCVRRVHEHGVVEGVRFFTMQHVEGETLADRLRRERPLALRVALGLFHQVASGIAAVHERGVVHRDVKPRNVLIDLEGRAYVTDFGLATSPRVRSVTRAGEILGTPDYMSPEQVRGEPADPRCDVFSLGVVLFELVSGVLPYLGATTFEAMILRTRAPARPLRALAPHVPEPLEALVARCLSRERKDRPANAREVVLELARAAAAHRRATPPRPAEAAATA